MSPRPRVPASSSFFITTAIDYTNAAPHIGHAYEKVLADGIARYQRLRGRDVFFLTGVDQHGQKVQQSAEKLGVPPQEFVDEITEKFRALWAKLGVEYDGWAATTDAAHKACVQTLLQRLHDEGQLYKARQAGYYSVRQEQFLTEKERGPDGEFGAEWGEVVLIEEENYYFKLAEHKRWLLDLLDSRPGLVTPGFRLAELRNAVEKVTGDLCISRPKARLTWGIELPFDPDYVTYVWFDALVNYISFAPGFDPNSKIQSPEFHAWWPALHVIGKDIMVPAHGVYWPIMLKAIGFADADIPTLLVHGWWNIAGSKMSKSLGNVVDPDALADKYGAETVRYYLMADIATGKDADFSEERLIQRYNVDLANSIGNLLNRTLNMAWKYRDGRLAKSAGKGLQDRADSVVQSYAAVMDDGSINAGLEQACRLANEANQYVEQAKPWALAKSGETAALDGALYHLAESLRIIAILLSPVMPKAARGIWEQLGVAGEFRFEDTAWGGLKDGHPLGKPFPLFPRIEAPANP
ncbi:MAG: class I tRNA ligase family protein [Terrimicrobiaceae bacterium]|nr:class I tRNA ligase family protein [Terrimicrobiaceae bacterium]